MYSAHVRWHPRNLGAKAGRGFLKRMALLEPEGLAHFFFEGM